MPKCGVLAVRIGALLSRHRNEVKELKRTQLARREKAKAHKDGELGRAQDTLRYCQDKLQGLYPGYRLSLRELVDSVVSALTYARNVGPSGVVSQENDKLRARIEHLEKNEKEQADAYARQWDSVRSTVEELKVKAPCWPDIILELADRLTKNKDELWQCRMELHRVESVCPVAHGPTWERVQKLAEMHKAARDRISYLETERANRPGDSFPSWRDAL